MNIGRRLEVIAYNVPKESIFADIGTDHAYLPVWLLQQDKIKSAVAGDIADGPCLAAKNTVAMYGLSSKIFVRKGSGLKVLQKGEVDCAAIAGMGGTTIIDILQADLDTAVEIKRLILQPMAGAPTLRKWLYANGWDIVNEELVEDGRHLYEVIVAERTAFSDCSYSEAELEIGPKLIENRHSLLKKQFEKQIATCKKLLFNMSKSKEAKVSDKYKNLEVLLQQLEALADECNCK